MNDLMHWIIPSKETLAIMELILIVGGWFNFGSNLWLGGIVCWCSAGIMAHD